MNMLKFGEKDDQDEDEDEEEEVTVEKDEDEDSDDADEDEGHEDEEEAEGEEKADGEEGEEKPLSKTERNRLRRQEQKERRRLKAQETAERFETLERTLQSEREEKEHLKQFLSKIAEKVDGRDKAEIDSRMTTAEQRYREAAAFVPQATAEMQKAVELGDGATFGRLFAEIDKAKAIMQQADSEWRALSTLKQRFTAEQEDEPAPQQREIQTVNLDQQRLLSYRKDWLSRNQWYDTSNESDDPDSLAARVIDRKLTKEGYKPDTKAFWDEFDRRIKARLPHKFRSAAKKPPQLVGGKESSAPKSGVDKEGELPSEFRKLLNERYGRDKTDPERKRAVAEYFKGLKEYRK
jgi:hypothetical protein